jgi:hypothetical protein
MQEGKHVTGTMSWGERSLPWSELPQSRDLRHTPLCGELPATPPEPIKTALRSSATGSDKYTVVGSPCRRSGLTSEPVSASPRPIQEEQPPSWPQGRTDLTHGHQGILSERENQHNSGMTGFRPKSRLHRDFAMPALGNMTSGGPPGRQTQGGAKETAELQTTPLRWSPQVTTWSRCGIDQLPVLRGAPIGSLGLRHMVPSLAEALSVSTRRDRNRGFGHGGDHCRAPRRHTGRRWWEIAGQRMKIKSARETK